MQSSLSAESDQTITQVFALDERESREDDNDAHRFKWFCDRSKQRCHILNGRRRCGYLDRNRTWTPFGSILRSFVVGGQFLVQLPNCGGRLTDRTAARHSK